MYQVIEQLAGEAGISADEASLIFKAFSDQLVNRIPAFKELIEDVFENAEPDKLKEHINKAITLLQHQSMDTFRSWSMPDQSHIRVRKVGNNSIF